MNERTINWDLITITDNLRVYTQREHNLSVNYLQFTW